MALGTVIAGLVRNAARSLVNFELAVDPIIERLQQACPPKAELEAIIRQKNSITTALTQVILILRLIKWFIIHIMEVEKVLHQRT